jgi:hypothetical protein
MVRGRRLVDLGSALLQMLACKLLESAAPFDAGKDDDVCVVYSDALLSKSSFNLVDVEVVGVLLIWRGISCRAIEFIRSYKYKERVISI